MPKRTRSRSLPKMPKFKFVDGLALPLGGTHGFKKVRKSENGFQGYIKKLSLYTMDTFKEAEEAAVAIARKELEATQLTPSALPRPTQPSLPLWLCITACSPPVAGTETKHEDKAPTALSEIGALRYGPDEEVPSDSEAEGDSPDPRLPVARWPQIHFVTDGFGRLVTVKARPIAPSESYIFLSMGATIVPALPI